MVDAVGVFGEEIEEIEVETTELLPQRFDAWQETVPGVELGTTETELVPTPDVIDQPVGNCQL